MEAMARELSAAYDALFAGAQPPWAQRRADDAAALPPTIPFIGREYGRLRTLLYASAENLSHYRGYLEKEEVAITNRHRYYFDQAENRARFFPFVHCAPINDGSLTTAAAYLCMGLGLPVDLDAPRAFLEGIAFANFGKFSIGMEDSQRRNRDYAGDRGFLKESYRYVEADLRILAPDVLILPKRIYDQAEVREQIARCLPRARCIPIYQINVGNVNRILARRFPMKPMEDLPPMIRTWHENIAWSGKSKANYLTVFSYLDEIRGG